jgi:hypothetical protein
LAFIVFNYCQYNQSNTYCHIKNKGHLF